MRPLTRRQALAAAAAATAPAVLAAADAAANESGDAAILRPLHRNEMFALAAYGTAQRHPSARVRALARPFRAHEAQHVAALATALEALGSTRFPPPRGLPALDREARRLGITPGFGERHGDVEVLRFLVEMEDRLVQDWVAAHAELADASLLRTAAEVLGCQAQHLVALRDALGEQPLPTAFEDGRS